MIPGATRGSRRPVGPPGAPAPCLELTNGGLAPFGGGVPLFRPDGTFVYLARDEGRVYRVLFTGNEAPNITQHPQNQTAAQNGSATFTVSATGTAPLSYQWQRAEAGTTVA